MECLARCFKRAATADIKVAATPSLAELSLETGPRGEEKGMAMMGKSKKKKRRSTSRVGRPLEVLDVSKSSLVKTSRGRLRDRTNPPLLSLIALVTRQRTILMKMGWTSLLLQHQKDIDR